MVSNILAILSIILCCTIVAFAQIEPIVLVHGGAGSIAESREYVMFRGTKLAVRLGYLKLEHGGSAVDAVEEAVRSMELDETFNAGLPIIYVREMFSKISYVSCKDTDQF